MEPCENFGCYQTLTVCSHCYCMMFSHSKQGYGFLFFTLKCYSAIAWLGDYSTNFATKKTLFFDWSKDFCGCDVSRFLHSALWKFLHLCIFTYFTCDVILYCLTCNFWNRPKGQKSVRQQLQNTWEVFQRSPSSATTVRPDWAVVKTIFIYKKSPNVGQLLGFLKRVTLEVKITLATFHSKIWSHCNHATLTFSNDSNLFLIQTHNLPTKVTKFWFLNISQQMITYLTFQNNELARRYPT